MELDLVRFVNDLVAASSWLTAVSMVLTSPWFGLGGLIAGTVAIWTWSPCRRSRGSRQTAAVALSLLAVVGLSDALGHYLLKPLLARPRPCHVDPTLFLPAGCGNGWSLPSNHALNAFSAAAFVLVTFPRAVWLALPLALLIACSRVVVGVHYPSDIAAGAILGTLIGWGSARVSIRTAAFFLPG